MTMPFYVSPEQVMKDRADYARKGIARGRSLVAMSAVEGIVIVAENPSRTLYKISEIYDRIAFAGVGKYNEFEMLRIAGVRQADLKGYSFAREDVNARSLANAYAQTLGQVFTHEMKPYEVEILVAQVGRCPTPTSCSTSSTTARSWTKRAAPCSAVRPRRSRRPSSSATSATSGGDAAMQLGAEVLAGSDGAPLGSEQLEVAFLDRTKDRRAFVRLRGPALDAALGRPDRSLVGRTSSAVSGSARLHRESDHERSRDATAAASAWRAGPPRPTAASDDEAAFLARVRPLARRGQGGVDLGGEQDERRVVELVGGHPDVDPRHVADREPVRSVDGAAQLHVDALRAQARREEVGGERTAHPRDLAHRHHEQRLGPCTPARTRWMA